MKNLVAAALLGMASVAAFAQVQVTAPQVQVTPMQAPAMAPAHTEGNSEMAPAEHKHHHRHHHHKKDMVIDAQK